MAECVASWTEYLMVGSSIPAVAQGYLIFPAQKDERHQGAHPLPRDSALICLAAHGLLRRYSSNGEGNNFNVKRWRVSYSVGAI